MLYFCSVFLKGKDHKELTFRRMIIIRNQAEVSSVIEDLRKQNKTIGFVPTMGALHEGHLTLVRRAVEENDVAMVSVFVNPTQFNNPTDLKTYPRKVEQDVALLESVGCTYVFTPEADEFYTKEEREHTFEFDFGGLDLVMEGKFRPGHFNGVVQVVSKLFKLVRPTRAYFGEKDFQQVAIIRRMVKVMHLDVNIVGVPVVRAADGLALSSRNSLLSAEEKALASKIYQVLDGSRAFAHESGVHDTKASCIKAIEQYEGLKVEYYDIVDGYTLQPLTLWDDSDYVVGCITVYCGKVRLIDHIDYKNPNS